MKKIIIAVILALLLHIGAGLERYELTVTTDTTPIQAANIHGATETLYPAHTADYSRTILLDNVQPGRVYRVTLDSNETHNTEDDAIISIREVAR